MRGRIKVPQLVAAPVVMQFGASQLDEFLEYSRELDATTITTPIQDARDLLIDDTGLRKADNYKYTHVSLAQVCKYTAAGLMRLIGDVSGLIRRVDLYDEVISVPTAAKIFNACVQLRFMRKDGLYYKQLISNTQQQVIDGAVGQLYRYLPNYYLYEIADAALAVQRTPPSFYHAQLVGRRLGMVFLYDDTLEIGGDVFSRGIYLVNSEAGECSVQTAAALVHRESNRKCIGKLYRVAHAGKQFAKNVSKLFGYVMQELEAGFVCSSQFNGLTQKKYDLSSSRVKTALTLRLTNWGVDTPIAETIVSWTSHVGGGDKIMPRQLQKEAAAQRTGMDVFQRILSETDECAPNIREVLEHAAFLLLTKTN